MRGKFNKNAVEGSFAAPLRISSASAGGRGEMGEGRGVRGEESLLVGRGRGGGVGGRGLQGTLPPRSAREPFSFVPLRKVIRNASATRRQGQKFRCELYCVY